MKGPDHRSSVLVSAVYNGWLEITRKMIDAKTHNVDSGTQAGFTPLMACALRNETHLARALLQSGADKTITDNAGRNALWFAVLFDRLDFVQFLLGKCLIRLK